MDSKFQTRWPAQVVQLKDRLDLMGNSKNVNKETRKRPKSQERDIDQKTIRPLHCLAQNLFSCSSAEVSSEASLKAPESQRAVDEL